MAIDDRAGMSPEARAALEQELAPLRGLDDVVRWGKRRSPPARIADVVVQDEFTHDVVVPLAEGLVLVFDTT